MKVSEILRRYLPWVNLPLGMLVAVLQRTPAVRVFAGAGDYVLASRTGELLRATITAATLGALHSRAGATTFLAQQDNTTLISIPTIGPSINRPVSGTVGTAIKPVVFTYVSAPSAAASFQIKGGSLPPGLSFIPPPLNGTLRSGTPAITGTPTQAGSFTIFVQGFDGEGLTNNVQQPINFEIAPAATAPPAISAQPQNQTASVGGAVTFAVQASGGTSFQWMKNGANVLGATTATLALQAVQVADAGSYAVVVSNPAGSVTSNPATLTVTNGSDGTTRLSNLSVRTAMSAGQTLIVGVVVAGGPRNLLVRAAGPALAGFGLTGAMSDPRLELYNGGDLIFENNDWPSDLSATFAGVGAFAFASGSRDAAFVQGVEGNRSIQARGTAAGVVLVEAYDLGAGNSPRLINVSARNRVGTGDDILIAGFNVAGEGVKQVLIRAVGPKLTAFGVSGVLNDPKLELHGGGAKIADNDNWSASLAPVFVAVGAFALDAGSRDAALVASLAPGSYTVQVSGVNNTTGEALVELYEVP